MREAKGDISMKLGVFTPVFVNRSLDQVVAKLRSLSGISAIEFATGGWPGRDHVEVDALLASPHKLDDFGSQIRDAGLTISALSCHGNPMHPNRATAREHDEAFRKSVKLAEKLNVPVVVTFSGCPGDSDEAKCPNWIVAPWPPEFLETLEWQWDKKVIPYWQDAGTFAADHGIKVAIEPHPGFVVYNVETALRLRAATGKNVGVNFDPSHLFWQGADIPVTIRALDGCIFHVHAKDSALDAANVARNGVLDAKSYRHLADRSWLFRTVGWGHDELVWKQIISALRMTGYDHVISIEHEDAFASVDEGIESAVAFLSRIVLRDPPVEPWWT
jgi:sugar phosphate isomerase/epimerase